MRARLFDVAGRVVIVTGGGRGIGRVYSEAFAQVGMRVVLADIHGEEAESAAAAIRAAGGEALAVRTDISRPEDAQARRTGCTTLRRRPASSASPGRSPESSARTASTST